MPHLLNSLDWHQCTDGFVPSLGVPYNFLCKKGRSPESVYVVLFSLSLSSLHKACNFKIGKILRQMAHRHERRDEEHPPFSLRLFKLLIIVVHIAAERVGYCLTKEEE